MNHILAAVDSTSRAKGVLTTAVELARVMGGKVRLFRAVGLPPELPSNLFALTPDQRVDSSIAQAKRELVELASEAPAELIEEMTAQIGVPWDAICAYAREHDVDLIVIGAHGAGLIDRIVGTTTTKVVNHADRSVYVVHSAA